jgi:hypothetical protein
MRPSIALSLALILILLAGFAPRAELRAQTEFHPRLLFDDDMLAWLPDSIAADSVRNYTWDRVESMGVIYKELGPDIVLATNYGSSSIPALGMVVHLADDPLATEVENKIIETMIYLADIDEVWGTGDDLSAASRLRTLLFGYDMAVVNSTLHNRERILTEIRGYLEVMTTDFTFSKGLYTPYCSNHSISIGSILVMAELCLRDDWPGDPLLTTARSLGDQLMEKGLADLLGEDGSYSEGGLYLAWISRILVPTWEAMARLDGIEAWDTDKIAAALDWVAYQLLPRGDGYFLNRNNCSEHSRPLCYHDTLWSWSQHRLPEPGFARWLQEMITGREGFNFGSFSDYPSVILYRNPGPEISAHERLGPDRFFPDQGLYAYRRGWVGDPIEESYQFTFQAGTYPGGHWQEDVGQITLRAFGLSLMMDHGPGNPAEETEGHNLPLVNGLGQHNAGSGIGTDGEMTLISGRGFLRALKADMVMAYSGHSPFNDPDYPLPGSDWSWGYDGGNPLERAERWVLLFPGEADEMPALYLLDDLRKDGNTNDYQWRLHHDRDMTVSVAGDAYDFDHVDGSMAGRLIAPTSDLVSWDTQPFDNGGPDEASSLLTVDHAAIDARFLWRFLALPPGAAEPVLSVERSAGGLLAVSGEAPDRVRNLIVTWNGSHAGTDYSLSGRFGVIEQEGGLERSALIEGSELWFDDRLTIRLDPPGWAVVDLDTVWMVDAETQFQVYSPTASVVMSDDTPVPFTRVGDYLFRGDPTATEDAAPGFTTGWSLRAAPGAPLRLSLAGPGAERARLEIYDLRGRRVARLLDGPLAAGRHERLWSGRDDTGRRQASGLYFARLRTDGASVEARLLLLR